MHVVFVCWGNICRSPMAERVAQAWAAREGVAATFSSAGVSSEESGNSMDTRARRVLDAHGYDSSNHRAHRITRDEIEDADLVIGLEDIHVNRMRQIAREADHFALLTDFDPAAEPGSGIEDPWYGPASGFEGTLASIEAAMPGLMDRLREDG